MKLCLWEKGFTDGIGQYPNVKLDSHVWFVQVGSRVLVGVRKGGVVLQGLDEWLWPVAFLGVRRSPESPMTRLGMRKLVPNRNSRSERIGRTSYAGGKNRYKPPSPGFKKDKQTILFDWKFSKNGYITKGGKFSFEKLYILVDFQKFRKMVI